MKNVLSYLCVCGLLFAAAPAFSQVGIFEDNVDIFMDYDRLGADGGVEYDAATGVYTMWGSGWDVWDVDDAFQFMYVTLSGDFALEATSEWDWERTTSTDDWIKVMLMARQDLDHDSVNYATRIRRDGQYSWQQRPEKGGGGNSTPSGERVTLGEAGINLDTWHMRLRRSGDVFTTYFLNADGEWQQIGQPQTLAMEDPILVGIGITSHDIGTLAYAWVSNVALTTAGSSSSENWELYQ